MIASVRLIAFATIALPALSAFASDRQPAQGPDLIPRPAKLTQTVGEFTITKSTVIWAPSSARDTAKMIAETVAKSSGFEPRVRDLRPNTEHKGDIVLTLELARGEPGDEGYKLESTPDGVRITSATTAGLFYAAQTLRQLIPIPGTPGTGQCRIACVSIEDAPRFGYRGFMLDSSRHFVKKQTILALLDALAQLKINRFHWHLVDDNAWRLEIPKYPQLVKPTSVRAGWYTQAAGYYTTRDVREIVERARKLRIVIVPEIEMPSHEMQAASVLPDACCLGPDGKPLPPGATREFCLGSDKAIAEVQDILLEVMALFPDSPVIHIGGDEAEDVHWRACKRCQARMAELGLTDPRLLQKWFMATMNKFVREHGRTSMAWADRLSLGIPDGQIVHSWHGGELAEAVNAGAQVVESNADYTYFDYGQGPGDTMFGGINLETKQVYALDPLAGVKAEQTSLVLGTQAQLWTELVEDWRVFPKTFPRILALAEVAWTPQELRDYTDFSSRLDRYLPRLDALGITYFKAPAVAGSWAPAQMSVTWKDLEWDVTAFVKKAGKIEFEFQYGSGAHGLAIQSAVLLRDGVEVGRDAHEGWTGAGSRDNRYAFKLSSAPSGKFVLRARVRSDGGTDSNGVVLVR